MRKKVLLITLVLVSLAFNISPALAATREENALDNFNVTAPNEIRGGFDEEEKSFIQSLGQKSKQILDKISKLFKLPPVKPAKVRVESTTLNQANSPLASDPKDPPEEQVKDSLGTNSGFYCLGLPKIEGLDNSVTECEQRYEKAWYPEVVSPITGQ